ncbi:MAG TPA: cation-transporting P-type ATPase, partial [Burkholderiaceae bacterium]|nr:cation-transporting P-type ATPase [Burkholderiaceae bacterium]
PTTMRRTSSPNGAGVSGRVRLGDAWHDARVGSEAFAGPGPGAPGGVRLAIDGRAIARFELSETPRADAAAALAALRADGASVGDGINDAPVLARADVSVAFATGAPLAQHQADLLLLGERLAPLAEARRLARRTMRVVVQNLAFAAVYNLVSIPLALAGLLPPWLAGLGMAASSLVVVLNALRLAHAPSREGSAPPLPAASPAA